MSALENYKPDFLGVFSPYLNANGTFIHGFQYAIGDVPQTIVGIKRILVGLQWHTGIETNIQHGLVKGDKVKIIPNTADTDSVETAILFNDVFTVTKVPNPQLFTVGVAYKSGMRLGGTWQLASSYVAPLNTPCDKGYSKDASGTCIPTPNSSSSNLIWWVVGGITILAVGIITIKLIKRHK